jgi:hypothetical protein
MGSGSPESEGDLVAGFLSRKPAAEATFVGELKQRLRAEICGNFPSLWPELRDLEQSALLRLCQMRENPREAGEIRPPLAALAKFLVDAPARLLLRRKKPLALQSWDGAQASSQEAAADLAQLLQIAAGLPRGMAKTVLAHAAHELGEGPPVEEVLGLDRRTAQRRLWHAQAVVLRIACGEQIPEHAEARDE